MDPVIITHRDKRLAILRNHSAALRTLRNYPVGAHVVRVSDGAVLSKRVYCEFVPPLPIEMWAFEAVRQ
jgi:hypothetical protein